MKLPIAKGSNNLVKEEEPEYMEYATKTPIIEVRADKKLKINAFFLE